jgi:predicted SnoaL-like aldol condensation-catalyzing enzyme
MRSLVFAGLMVVASLAVPHAARAQEPVVGVPNADALFTSSDPVLNANKQAVYHIMKDLLEDNHWELAGKYLTARYLQHNPLVQSGRAPVVHFFTAVLKRKPTPITDHLVRTKIVAVVAEGDLVIVATPRVLKDPKDPSKTYTTTWFDMWRMKNGKADEHWDCQTKS